MLVIRGLPFIPTGALFGVVFISRRDLRRLSPDELDMALYHEEYHARRPLWFLYRPRHWDETLAEAYAVRRMVARGYTVDEALLLTVNYWFLHKYGCRYGDFRRLVSSEVTDE